MKVSNSIIAHGTHHPSLPSSAQVSQYIRRSVEESPLGNREALVHTPFQVPHHDNPEEEVAHTFDGRSGGLGLLMKLLDEKFGHNEVAPKRVGFEEIV